MPSIASSLEFSSLHTDPAGAIDGADSVGGTDAGCSRLKSPSTDTLCSFALLTTHIVFNDNVVAKNLSTKILEDSLSPTAKDPSPGTLLFSPGVCSSSERKPSSPKNREKIYSRRTQFVTLLTRSTSLDDIVRQSCRRDIMDRSVSLYFKFKNLDSLFLLSDMEYDKDGPDAGGCASSCPAKKRIKNKNASTGSESIFDCIEKHILDKDIISEVWSSHVEMILNVQRKPKRSKKSTKMKTWVPLGEHTDEFSRKRMTLLIGAVGTFPHLFQNESFIDDYNHCGHQLVLYFFKETSDSLLVTPVDYIFFSNIKNIDIDLPRSTKNDGLLHWKLVYTCPDKRKTFSSVRLSTSIQVHCQELQK